MTAAASVRPRGPYSLSLSARLASDATRSFAGGALTAVLPGGGLARGWQRPDGTVELRGSDEAALEALRACLAIDDDHSEFVHRFRSDPLLGASVRHLRGLRVVRVPTVAQALLRALCGQLVDSRSARMLERRVVAATARRRAARLYEPPTERELGRLSPAQLRASGLHARRGATLVRLCRSLQLERLRSVPTTAAARLLACERGLGPWSAGVVCLEGLGRREVGLVGDLGLIKLCAALRGRDADAADTEELLEPYGDWAGLASVYLLAGLSRGLVPLSAAA